MQIPLIRHGANILSSRVLLKRFGEEFVEKYGFLLGNKERKPVMKRAQKFAEHLYYHELAKGLCAWL